MNHNQKDHTGADDSRKKFLDTQAGKTKTNAIETPSISLPKGGGAIKGIDEKFSVNAVNGTASFSIPLPFSAARGASPGLSLSYNSGSGNGIFGLGWNIGLASIKRKTDKELPQYIDAIDSDTFLFSEAEDLVPAFKKDDEGIFLKDVNDEYIIDEHDAPGAQYTIRYYKPRTEGLFARIERWRSKNSEEIKWRVTTKENTTTLYGWTAGARTFDPLSENKISEWLPEFVFDDKGNCAHYIYKKEDSSGFDTTQLHNRNRWKNGQITYTQTYIKQILYGNKVPYKRFGDPFPEAGNYLFSTVFDYGEYNPVSPYDIIGDWAFRPDAFSEYRSGFEIRTTRLCRRVLLFHHFTGANEYDGLVKSLNLSYDTNIEEHFTFLAGITHYGYIKKEDGSYTHKKLPPMEFSYQPHQWNSEVKTIGSAELVHAPAGLDDGQYQFTDLYNEGLSGILTEQANGWYYKRNAGNGEFEQAKLVSPKPSFVGLGAVMQLSDLDADGGKQLVSYNEEPMGFFELSDEEEWQPLQYFKELPRINFNDPNTRMIDLDGDGRAEIVITEENAFTWFPSQGRKGFASARKTQKPFDEEEGPALIFADEQQTIFLADVSGDGLTDILRIRNGEACYWPNLGYGIFGAKVAMDNAPVFDHPHAFNASFIRLADIDGSGTSDIIYLGKNKFTCWKNLCGNRFSTTPFEIESFPEIHPEARVTVTDLLGNGVACIVWSSALSKNAASPLQYIDLMNGRKPHIMTGYKNNMGREVRLEYTPSTQFYIADKKAGRPWVTKLHFPVHCLSKVTAEDKITGHRYTSEYSYHHGYYDHAEREFRGFGMTEQKDAETFEHWIKSGAANITEEPLHQEPVITKTWHHTGAFLQNKKILSHFKDDYWYAEMERQGFSITHPETDLPDAAIIAAPGLDMNIPGELTTEEWREALRVCKGMTIRSEIFAKDAVKYGNTEAARKKELTPFTVGTHNCLVELLQPRGRNRHAVFMVKESEAITYNYERNPDDARIAHSFNLETDEYGNVLEAASVVYPRQLTDDMLPLEIQQEQAKTIITYTQSGYTNDVIGSNAYRLRLPCESRTFELKGVPKTTPYYTPLDFENILSDVRSDEAFYHEINKPLNAGKAQRRLIEHSRNLFYNNDLLTPLNLHQLQSLALPYEAYQLAYTPELIADIYVNRTNNTMFEEGKFTNTGGDNNWWVRSGTTQYLDNGETDANAADRFYTPVSYTDPYGARTKVSYYSSYFLFINETENALGNKVVVEEFNFRTVSPARMKDMNGNLSETITDELGMIKAYAVMGKGNEADSLNGFTEATEAAETNAVQSFFAAPDSIQLTASAKNLLQQATSRFVYDFDVYMNTGKPTVVAAISREEHASIQPASPVQVTFEYYNGIDEVTMKKVQAEPGMAKQVIVQAGDTITINEINTAAANPRQLRWLGSGRVVKNNKGNTVKQYEPYFSVTHQYEDNKELVETGVTSVLYYDAAGRLIKTIMPDGTFSKIEFDSWKHAEFDANDTILETEWYTNRTNRLTDAELIAEGKDPSREKQAADNAAKHANTPGVMHFDTLGRPVLAIDHNINSITNTEAFYHTTAQRDAEGNLRFITDARGNTTEYKYDMLGNKVYQNNPDAGQRWLLININGQPLRTWDERNHQFQYFYDILQRPTSSVIQGGDGPTPLNNIYSRTIYGESLLLPGRTNEAAVQADNALGQPIQLYDTAGLIDTPIYDFKGKPISSTRRLFSRYKETANWTDANLAVDLEPGAYTFTTETDALGRISRQVAPDGSIITPLYNEAGLLNSEMVLHAGAASAVTYIRDIDYDEKSRREKIIYGNDVTVKFHYDKKTFRLQRLESKRQNNDPLQHWQYTYDPVGNVTHIEDRNIPVTFFDNQKITGLSAYVYDSLSRLIEAKGRENDSALSFNARDNWNDNAFMNQMNPGDSMAMRNYTQSYQYDAAGNITQMGHVANSNNWTRNYAYQSSNNRLISTTVGNTTYNYTYHAAHGFIMELPHLEETGWNFREELVRTIQQKRLDGGTPETTWYQYDSGGQRIRKITENTANAGAVPTKKEERIYISGYELYKKHSGSNAGLERTTLGLSDKGNRFVLVETRNAVDDGTQQHLVRYQLNNNIGSAAMELDENAAVISYEEFHPYGTTAYQARNNNIRSAHKRYRFTGMERDEETGLEYHNARYYLPWLGRWLSCDPAGTADGLCVYQYSKNNPVMLADINGMQAGPWSPYVAFRQMAEKVNETFGPTFKAAESFSDELIKGDFHEGETSWGGVAGQVGVGMIPYVGQVADARDTTAAASKVIDHPTSGSAWGGLAMAGVGWVPLIGDAAKGVTKVGKKAVVEVEQKVAQKLEQKAVKELEQKAAQKAEQKVEQKVAQEVEQKAAQKAEKKAVEAAKPGLGESMIKPEKRSGLNVDLAAQPHKDKTAFRKGSGKKTQSAHMVNSSSMRDISNYVRDRALTVLLPKKHHRAFDDHWKKWAKDKIASLKPGQKAEVTVAEWEKVLNEAASSVPELKGRTADTMSVMIRTELYQTLGLKPDQMIRIPFSKK